MWAVGVCLYELMSHRHPFNATDIKTLMQRILRCHYDPLPTNYTRDLREIVQKVLVKDPARRPRYCSSRSFRGASSVGRRDIWTAR